MRMKKNGALCAGILDHIWCAPSAGQKALVCSMRFPAFFLQWPLTLAWGAIGCTCLGHFLMKRDPLPVYLAAAMIFIGFIICFAGTWVRSVHAGKLEAQMLEGLSLGPCFLAVGFFFNLYATREKGIREAGVYSKGTVRRGVLRISGASAGSARADSYRSFRPAASVLPFRFRSLRCCVSQAATASICF